MTVDYIIVVFLTEKVFKDITDIYVSIWEFLFN